MRRRHHNKCLISSKIVRTRYLKVAMGPINKSMDLLSRLMFQLAGCDPACARQEQLLAEEVLHLGREEFRDLLRLANSNHVIVRALEALLRGLRERPNEWHTDWALSALEAERARIAKVLPLLSAICREFEISGYGVMVIKSLDHLPDIGSDLDLYTVADPIGVLMLMEKCFDAKIASPSWGDRLACKLNFLIPGFTEAVEVHVGRLGQTGEQVTLASSLLKRRRPAIAGGIVFTVPSATDRILISTLQRMYRHFYFRLCDMVDCVALAETDGIDYFDLRSSANGADIWEGAATYLAIVSDYANEYRSRGLNLPGFVRTAAQFGGDAVFYGREFLRVRILPQCALLYALQLTAALRRRRLKSSARLGMLPFLATAAAIGKKVTGSDKGIW